MKKKNMPVKNNKIQQKANNSDNKTSTVTLNAITLAGFCAVCWKNALYFCPDCRVVGYCCMSHMAAHLLEHEEFCIIIHNLLNDNNKGFLYKHDVNSSDEWRFVRLKTIETIKDRLNRDLKSYERDLLLFPKYCSYCFETNLKALETCKKCHQIWYCRNDLDHYPKNHKFWCDKLQLFANLVRKQAIGKLFAYDMNLESTNFDNLSFDLKDNITNVIKNVLNTTEELDECALAMISQAVTGPLTVLYALKSINYRVTKNLTIHLIGAELHFEGKTLPAWEYFFLHFLFANCINLKIIMVGPELNCEIPKENLRLCEKCQKNGKTISFEYRDRLLYHQYAKSKNFSKPNVVCAFNPGFHRTTGFNQCDTWPQTIKTAVRNKCPFVFTAYTAFEAPLDLQRVQECELVHVLTGTERNPFASLKPDRNFISDQESPLIYKNYYINIVTTTI